MPPQAQESPTPPHSPVAPVTPPQQDSFFDRDEVLRVEEDGQISMDLSSTGRNKNAESPVVPVVRNQLRPSNNNNSNKAGSSSGESTAGDGDTDHPSADDEGSVTKEEEEANGGSPDTGIPDATPRTKRRVESLKQGLAARRIQRTWKHFYEEVCV